MRASSLALVLALLVGAPGAEAHVVYGAKTLRGLVAESDLVVQARIAAVGAGPPEGDGPPGGGRPTLEAEVLDVLKGRLDAPRVRFAQHGHGVAPFEPGRETLLFLVDIARSRELDALAEAGTHAWVSLQEHQDEYPLEAGTRERLLAATRAYVMADAAASAEVRDAVLRRATLGLLTSDDPRLAASAVRDLVLAPAAPLVSAEDGPALQRVLDDAGMAMGVRVALLSELERRGIVDGPPVWLRLVSADTPTRDRVVAIRAAGSSASPAVRVRLTALVLDPDPAVAAAAALAVGAPGNVVAVEPLAQALAGGPEPVRMAAIRGLGGVASREAERALEAAAESHPDASTRRRARAELRKLRGRREAE